MSKWECQDLGDATDFLHIQITWKGNNVVEMRLDTTQGSNQGSRQRGMKRLGALTHTAIAYAATSL
jgi:hypothetical protein